MPSPAVIDSDVHHNWKSDAEVLAYLPKRWRDALPSLSPPMMWLQQSFGINARLDSFGPDGAKPGSDYETIRTQYLNPYNVRKAKLSFYIGQNGGLRNPYAAVEVLRAMNDWNRDTWLSIKDDRLVSVVLIQTQDPVEAAKEVRRVAGNPKIIEVLLVPNPLGKPFGHPIYHPIYEAAHEVGLPVGVHIGGESFETSNMHVAGGSAHCKMDFMTLQPEPMMHHLISFITHGVFEKFPKLKLMMIECGVAWLPWFLTKMDSMYDTYRQESSWVKKLPSEYIRQHMKITTQPLELSPRREDLIELLKSFEGMEDILCYASDYPHWDADDPLTIQSKIPPSWHAKVFYNNAAAFYGFPQLSEKEILERKPVSAAKTALAGAAP